MKKKYKASDIIDYLMPFAVDTVEQENILSSAYRYAECLEYFHSWLESSTPLDVLDLGTGKGWIALLIRRNFPQHRVTASDVLVKDHVRARLETGGVKVVSDCRFLEQNALPLAEDAYDRILFLEALEHIIAEPRYIFREIYRITRPGGCLLFTTPNLAYLFSRLLLLSGIQPQFYLTGLRHGRSMPRNHFREWTMKELVMLVEDAGYTTEARTYLHGHGGLGASRKKLHLRLAFYVFRLLMILRPTLRGVVGLVARKPETDAR